MKYYLPCTSLHDSVSRIMCWAHLLCACALWPLNTMASMSIDRMVIHFDPRQPLYQDVTVSNPDDEPLYLETEIFRVINPGPEETLEKASKPEEVKLLTTPQKAIVPPKGYQTIRLMKLETPKETEQVYRVTFRPVVGEQKASKSAVKIVIAYQALVFIRPEKPSYNIAPLLKQEHLLFENTGNTHVTLRNVKYCTDKKGKECHSLKGSGRIYAGRSRQIDILPEQLKDTKLIRYGLFDGQVETPHEFTPPQKNS